MPSFNCITSTNTTRATEIAKNNTPIQPVDYNIEGDELEVTFKKTVTEFIGSTGKAHGTDNQETFYMASLKAPIAEKNWKIDARDRMSLLMACCKNCIGAVGVEPLNGID